MRVEQTADLGAPEARDTLSPGGGDVPRHPARDTKEDDRLEPPEAPRSSAVVDAVAAVGIGLIPVVGSSILTVLDQVQQHRDVQAMRTLAEMTADIAPDRLRERLQDDQDVQALFINGVDYALRTGHEGKRRLLARVVRAAVLDDARIDDSLLYLYALRDLDAPHFRLLARLRQARLDLEAVRGLELTEERMAEERNRYSEYVRHSWDQAPGPVQAALVRTGCAIDPDQGPTPFRPPRGQTELGITAFGMDLVGHVQSAENP